MKAPSKLQYRIQAANEGGSDERSEVYDILWEPLKTGGRVARLTVNHCFDEATITSAKAYMKIRDLEDAHIFMNGFQTWTYCPEYTVKDRIRGVRRLPKGVINAWSLDRYGDYHFVDYPYKRGRLHGVSYCYFRDGERFLLIASVSEENGYTLFDYDAKEELLTIKRDCEGLKVVERSFTSLDIIIADGTEDEVFDAWFSAMGVAPLTTQRISGYSSWYNRYQDISEQSISEDLAGCAKVMRGGELFQIDDGWEPAVGDWLESDKAKFPNGMKAAADAIHKKGYRAGLWLAPFVAQKDSKLFKEHPDWFFMHDGEPWCDGSNWGGFYSLDIDNSEVVAYLEEVFRRVFDEWGFDLVKLDFLYGAAPFGTEFETRGGRMIRAMKLLRSLCGEHPILGCGVPVMPAFGLVEYCRVSCDVGLDWDDKPWMRMIHRERVSTRHAMGNTVFRRQLNGRAFLSDPDVFFLREDNIRMSESQKLKLAKINALFGSVFLTSDNIGNYDGRALTSYRRLLSLRDALVTNVETVGKTVTVTYESNGKEYSITFK